ncbi:DUF421 domain-containing protein [Ectobacillus funiculus]|uniref:DUF421 domain-containing protein n=1 Tax=Ectobacillus funiculus TaxID=137993 RepID=UPI00397BE3B3
MPHWIETILRTIAIFILLMVITNLQGKQLSAHTLYYNLALWITLGSIAGNAAFNTNLAFFPMVISVMTICLLAYVFSFVSLKNRRLRKWISGYPTMIIEKGLLLDENMKKMKYSLDDLNEGLRQKDIFNIEEVEYALLESNGALSVLKKEQYRPLTKQDLSLQTSQGADMPIEFIMDGEIIHKNLNYPYTMDWLLAELKKRNTTVEDTYYVVKGTNGKLYIDLYKDGTASFGNSE